MARGDFGIGPLLRASDLPSWARLRPDRVGDGACAIIETRSVMSGPDGAGPSRKASLVPEFISNENAQRISEINDAGRFFYG